MRPIARLHTPHDLAGEREVGERPLRFRFERERRHTVRGCLSEPHVAGNDRPIQALAEVTLEFRRDVQRERIARVVHGAQQPFDLERRIQVSAHFLDRLHQI
jgi:hypothetical protein